VFVSLLSGRVSASGRSLVQRGPIECDVSECDHETWAMGRPHPTRRLSSHGRKKMLFSTKCEFVYEYHISCSGVLANALICPINLTRCHLLYILETIRSILAGSKVCPASTIEVIQLTMKIHS